MIDDGCLEDGKYGPYVDEVYGIHLWSRKLSTDSTRMNSPNVGLIE